MTKNKELETQKCIDDFWEGESMVDKWYEMDGCEQEEYLKKRYGKDYDKPEFNEFDDFDELYPKNPKDPKEWDEYFKNSKKKNQKNVR